MNKLSNLVSNNPNTIACMLAAVLSCGLAFGLSVTGEQIAVLNSTVLGLLVGYKQLKSGNPEDPKA